MENGKVSIHDAYLSDWSSLRELLLTYADSSFSLKKDTWDWIVKRADNTYVRFFSRLKSFKMFKGDPTVTWNYFTGFDDAATG